MKFRPELASLKPYSPPRASLEADAEHAAGARRNGGSPNGRTPSDGYVKLTSNELSFGPLPEAETAMQEALPRLNRYPDRYAGALREAVAGANPGAEPANVLVGNGSSEVLLNLLQIVERPGEVVFPWPSFGLYASICVALGLSPVRVPLDGAAVDPEAMLGAVGPETRAVVLCNPNNPTGTYLTLDEVRAFADELPEGVLLILDEAYYEFVSDPAYHGSHELALQRPNVVVARTFSKAHGLAGLRVGYGIAPDAVADYFERVRFPFSVNLAAQAAASASMHAHDRIRARAEFVVEERTRLQDAFAEAGLAYIPSQANFVLVEAGPEVFEKNGVLVREGEALGWHAGWSRITVGDRRENGLVIGALQGVRL